MDRQVLSQANRPTNLALWLEEEPDLLANTIFRAQRVSVY